MEKLSLRKQQNIIRLFFGGFSYRDIAIKTGVSTGAIANVIAELKAGIYPELSDVADQVDLLKELAIEVKKSKLSVSECATGIAVINGLTELGIEPGDVLQCLSVYKTLTPDNVETQTFVKAAMEYKDVLQRTGLSVEDLEKKVTDLEKAANQLQPLTKKVLDLQNQLKGIETNKASINNEVTALEKRDHVLTETVKEKEHREEELSTRIISLEEKLQSDEERLAVTRKDLAKLAAIGLSVDELSGITERIKCIAHRLGVVPKVLNDRLLTELEQLKKGMTLEALVQTKQRELQTIHKEIVTASKKSEILMNQIQINQEELSSIQTQVAYERKTVTEELKKIIAVAQSTKAEFSQNLAEGLKAVLDQVILLKDVAVEAGREMGQIETKLQENNWLNDILSVMKGEDKFNEINVRVIILELLSKMSLWLERNYPSAVNLYMLKTTIKSLISELEKWKPKINMLADSKNFKTN